MSLSAGEIDEMTQGFKERILYGETIQDRSTELVNERYFLICSYDYQNYSIVFRLDMGANMMEYIKSLQEEISAVYIRNDTEICQVSTDGAVKRSEITWDDCSSSGIRSQAFLWSGQQVPLEVCIRTQYTGLADDPGRILDPVGGRRLVPGSDTYTVEAATYGDFRAFGISLSGYGKFAAGAAGISDQRSQTAQ